MHIHVQYTPDAKTLAKASRLYIEKKPLFVYGVGLANLIIGLFLVIFLFKLLAAGLTFSEWGALAICCAWLFGRSAFTQWLLTYRMKHSLVVDKPLTIELSLNGMAWSGKGIRPGSMPWDQIKYVIETQNGFILPHSFTRFVWLPFEGFKTLPETEELRAFLLGKNVPIQPYPKWRC